MRSRTLEGKKAAEIAEIVMIEVVAALKELSDKASWSHYQYANMDRRQRSYLAMGGTEHLSERAPGYRLSRLIPHGIDSICQRHLEALKNATIFKVTVEKAHRLV